MAVEKQGAALDAVNSQSTRTLLRTIILFLIAGAAIASRLFSVIRTSADCAREATTRRLSIIVNLANTACRIREYHSRMSVYTN